MKKDYGFPVIKSAKQIVYCASKFFVLKLINKFCFTILCVLLSGSALGQQFSIAGKIFDETNQPIAYTNIIVLKTQDSTIVTGTTSDDFGKFTLNAIDSGNYIIKASFISYEDNYSNITVKADLQMPSIILKESFETLSEV